MDLSKEIDHVLSDFPTLTSFGLGSDPAIKDPYRETRWRREDRLAMRASTGRLKHVIAWLGDCEKTGTINPGCPSPYLRYLCEQTAPGPISHGVFILGALLCGFRIQQIPPFCLLNISEMSVEAKRAALASP